MPARSVQTRACATRDILSRWRTAHIHVRRPPGVLLLTRVRGVAALGLKSDFKRKPHGLPVGAAQAATAPLRARRNLQRSRNVAVAASDRRKSSRTPLLQGLRCSYTNGCLLQKKRWRQRAALPPATATSMIDSIRSSSKSGFRLQRETTPARQNTPTHRHASHCCRNASIGSSCDALRAG